MSDPKSEFPLLSVSMEKRYGSAWAEINARLTSRQNALLAFATGGVTAVSVLAGVAFKLPEEKVVWQGALEGLAVGLVALTWAVTLLIRNNDALIGLLGVFCKTLELRDDPNNTIGLPAWHNDEQEWILFARKYRRYSDAAATIIAFLASVPAFVFGYHELKLRAWPSAILFGAGALGVVAAIYLYFGFKLRKEIAERVKFKQQESGKWKMVYEKNKTPGHV